LSWRTLSLITQWKQCVYHLNWPRAGHALCYLRDNFTHNDLLSLSHYAHYSGLTALTARSSRCSHPNACPKRGNIYCGSSPSAY
jgi:hypothetical protein